MITKPKKYTEKWVLGESKKLLDELLNDTKIVYKGELFTNREYSRQRFSEWVRDFKNNRQISDTLGRIDEILETRAVAMGIKGKGNSSFIQFHLKNNYNWKDKQDHDINAKGNIKVEVEYVE